ncbi:MAG: pyridoxal-phosphate dependent enzyme [Bryobacteraceae bacterium]
MIEQWLECLVCAARYDIAPMLQGCPRCARAGRKGAIEVRYSYDSIRSLSEPDMPGLWKWRPLLPAIRPEAVTSLHEGSTPLVPLDLASGSTRVFVKNETMNPTWAHKDRPNVVTISMARHFGYRNIVAVSTGNHGNSAAAYSAAGGLGCVVFCNANAPREQTRLMRHYGARVFVGGESDKLAAGLMRRGGWFPSLTLCPRGGFASPFAIEGFKTIAFEIFEQLGGRVPDRVFVPASSGDGLYGIAKGFRELVATGHAGRIPRMVACQTVRANFYVRAFREGSRTLKPVSPVETVALSIGDEIGGLPALWTIYETGGEALESSEEAILAAARDYARLGLALEPASSAALACARAHSDFGRVEETWVLIGTGTAIRWPQTFQHDTGEALRLPSGFDNIDEILPPG